ncbi:MAG: T9SS type A sorting domain-containing protein [Flavobacteriaceae bacterium]
MKYLYLILFMGFCLVLSGQEKPNQTTAKTSKDSMKFDLYPNPAFQDVVYVTTSNNSGKDITIYDIFGKVVLKDRIAANKLNISRLIPGVYFLQVDENNKSMTRKLVVK